MVKMPSWPIPYGRKAIDLDLTRIRRLLKNLGNPQNDLPPIIHVAGTNGKGSTIAYLKAIFESAGYSVHCYISPHLMRFNERIILGGHEITDRFLDQCIEECRVANDEAELTFFEGTTAMAFLAFAKVKADVLLLETGLGGRLDATNVVDSPLLSIITPISLDHTEYLGENVCQIAAEKAGIIKKNAACVIAWQQQQVLEVLKGFCNNRNAPYFACTEHWNFQKSEDGFTFILPDVTLELPTPSLHGVHQIMNASCAVASILQIMDKYAISIENIKYGLKNAIWPARLQHITSGTLQSLLPKGSELWLDGAHNIAGAEMLALSVSQFENQEKLLYLVNGRTGQRDIAGFLKAFLGKVERLYAVRVLSEPLSHPPRDIKEVATEMGFTASESEDLKDAIISALADANGRDCRILICGSLYLAADLLLAN